MASEGTTRIFSSSGSSAQIRPSSSIRRDTPRAAEGGEGAEAEGAGAAEDSGEPGGESATADRERASPTPNGRKGWTATGAAILRRPCRTNGVGVPLRVRDSRIFLRLAVVASNLPALRALELLHLIRHGVLLFSGHAGVESRLARAGADHRPRVVFHAGASLQECPQGTGQNELSAISRNPYQSLTTY